MHLLLTILLLLFLLAAPIILLILRIAGKILYFGKPRTSSDNTQKRTWSSTFSRQKPAKKVFEPNEGEYVDFEEIKNN